MVIKFTKRIFFVAALSILLAPFYCFAGQFYLGPTLVLQMISAESENYAGISPKFTLGYGARLSEKYTLGYELFGTFSSLSVTNENDFLKPSYTFGASILPGIVLNETTMLYGRLGAVITQFSDTPYTQGAQVGLGLQKKLTDKWDMRGEYSYTAYRSVDQNDNDATIHSPKSNTVSIGFVRKL